MAEPRVLLADDDEVGRYVVAAMLRRAGFDVSEVSDGVEAVEAAQREAFDVAVLDVKMPRLDGFEACRQLRADDATRHVPVLLLSATFQETERRVQGLDTGADAYLTQPVEAPVLAATVRALLRAREAEQEVRIAAREWQATFDAISDAVAVLDAGGALLRANRVFAATFGEQRAGAPMPELVELAPGTELERDGRVFRARVDRITEGEDRVVVTLSDITAERAVERERARALAVERTISRTLQQSLLPERLPPHPRLALHAWHVAAESELIIGGDWYDAIESEHGLWLVMGDVAGHGVAAAAAAGQLRHSLRVYAHEGYDLVESVARLNELVLGQNPTEMATLCVVAVDAEAARARFVLAGHPPVLVVPRDGEPHFAEGGRGIVLGVDNATCSEGSFDLAPGDRFVLFTDGLVERPGEPLDVSLERLRAGAAGTRTPRELREQLVGTLADTGQLRDDVALLIAQRV